MFLELLSHSWMYGASFENYYELQFFKKSRTECRQYLTSSLRHELTRQVNDPCEALVLKDKVRFSEYVMIIFSQLSKICNSYMVQYISYL